MQWYKNKKVYRISFLVLSSILIVYFLILLRGILIPFIIGFLVAYLLNPLVKRLEDRKISRGLSIFIVFIGVLGVFFLIGFYGFPKIIAELNKFADAVPQITKEVQKIINNINHQYASFRLPDSLRQVLDDSVDKIEEGLLRMVSHTINSILALFSQIFNLFIAPIVAFYILKDMEKIKKGISNAIPREYRSDIMGLLRDIDDIIFKFLKGNLLVGLIVGILTSLGMTIIGVRFAIIIGIIAAITNLIPFIGPFIGAIPAIILALLQSKILALYAIIIIFIIQQIEGNVLSPKILGNSVGLHPLWVIFSLLAGGQMMGITGMIIAVPIAAVIKVIARFMFLKLVG